MQCTYPKSLRNAVLFHDFSHILLNTHLGSPMQISSAAVVFHFVGTQRHHPLNAQPCTVKHDKPSVPSQQMNDYLWDVCSRTLSRPHGSQSLGQIHFGRRTVNRRTRIKRSGNDHIARPVRTKEDKRVTDYLLKPTLLMVGGDTQFMLYFCACWCCGVVVL